MMSLSDKIVAGMLVVFIGLPVLWIILWLCWMKYDAWRTERWIRKMRHTEHYSLGE